MAGKLWDIKLKGNMKDELLKVIKANLPETVAGEMKEFINQAEQTKIDLEKAEFKIEGLEGIIVENNKDIKFKDTAFANLNKSLGELQDQIKKCEDCKDRYLQLGYKEQVMDIQNQHSVARVNDAKEYLGIAFKSPVFKKEVATMKGIPIKCADYMDYNTTPPTNLSGGETLQDSTEMKTTTKTEE